MFRKLLPIAVLAGSYAGLIAALVLTAGELPPVVASHFNASGAPDGWMPRDSYLWAMFGVAAIVPLLMVGSLYIIRFLGASAINMPHRDYWLAPERRAETYAAIFRLGLWIASISVLTVLGAHLFTVAANNAQPVVLSSSIWLLLAGFVTANGILVFSLYRRFKLPAK